MDLSTIQNAAARKAVCEAATAEQSSQSFLDAQHAAQQTAYINHFSSLIGQWANQTDDRRRNAAMASLNLPINEILDTLTLDAWESTLTGLGYTVTRSGASFKIDLPSQ
jgi:hypothetical protein